MESLRPVAGQVAEKMGMPVDRWVERTLQSPTMQAFRKLLFSKIILIVKRLGLLTPRTRPAFEALGILEFEDDPRSGSNPDEGTGKTSYRFLLTLPT